MIKAPKKFLEDILFSIERIEESMGGLSELGFKHNIEKQDAILRRLSVIGEAAKNLPNELKEKYQDTEWGQITGMRNIIIHEYFGIKLDGVWQTLVEDIPVLKKQIMRMLKETATK